MENIKVLHINNYDTMGGAEVVYNLTLNNRVYGVENLSGHIVTEKNNKSDINFENYSELGKLNGIFKYIFSNKNYNQLYNYLLKNDINVVHIHGFFSALSPSILLALKKIKKIKKLKVIQTVHDFHMICPNSALYNYKRNEKCERCIGRKMKVDIFKLNCDRRGRIYSIIKGIRSIVANNILNHSNIIDIFICPSNFMKEKLLQEGINIDKIEVIRNPINITAHSKENTLIEKENYICYFGRLSLEKNVKFIVEVFEKFRKNNDNNFKLLIIGSGESESELRNYVRESVYRDDIIIKSFMKNEQLMDEISKCKIFFMASTWYENAPMSIVEAINNNIVPVVNGIGGMKEYIELFECGYWYNENSINDAINKLNLINENYNFESTRVHEAKKRITNEFSSEVYFNNLKEIYFR